MLLCTGRRIESGLDPLRCHRSGSLFAGEDGALGEQNPMVSQLSFNWMVAELFVGAFCSEQCY